MTEEAQSQNSGWMKRVIILLLLSAAVGAYLKWGDHLSLKSLAQQEANLTQHLEQSPVLVYSIAFLVYVAVTGFSLPGAAILSLVYAWFFKFVPGVILVSFASTLGACLAFLMSRYALRDLILKKFGNRLQSFNAALERDGAFYLFTLRLIPAVPFFVINLVMGLTPIRLGTFWIVSQIGMLPGTAVYVFAGSQVPDLNTLREEGVGKVFSPQVIIAFVALGIFPFIVKYLMKKFRPQTATTSDSPSTEQPVNSDS